jgi:hypothetical protein
MSSTERELRGYDASEGNHRETKGKNMMHWTHIASAAALVVGCSAGEGGSEPETSATDPTQRGLSSVKTQPNEAQVHNNATQSRAVAFGSVESETALEPNTDSNATAATHETVELYGHGPGENTGSTSAGVGQ